MLPLLLVAVSVGLSNLAAAVGIGVSGVDSRTRLRVGLVFGVFESGMPIVGLIIGRSVAGQLGHTTQWIGGGLLVAVGAYSLVQSIRQGRGAGSAAGAPGSGARSPARLGLARLLLSGLALSMDNLVVGFALGTFNVGILLGAVVIGAVSVAMSLAGLELGVRIGRLGGRRGEQIGGVVLMSVGVAIAVGLG